MINLSRHSKAAKLEEIGVTGLKRFGGYVYAEPNTTLQGLRGAEIFDKMATSDAIIGGGLFAIESICKQVPWFAKPGGSKKKDIRAAKFLEQNFYDMSTPWPQTVSEILTMNKFGWSWLEKVYKIRRGPFEKDKRFKSQYSDGRVGWGNWAPRSQLTLSRWEYEEGTDRLLGMVQLAPPDFNERFIPLEKSLLFRIKTANNNPEGVPLIRGAYDSWLRKCIIEDIEATGLERDLAGYPILYVPKHIADPDPADTLAVQAHNEYLELITNIRNDEAGGLMLSSETDANGNRVYELKLLSSSGMKQFNTTQIISRYNQAIGMSFMVDFLLLGAGRQGSYALSETKARLFGQGVTGILDSISETINQFAVADLAELNPDLFEDLERYPEIAHGKVEMPNLTQLADYLQKLGYKAPWALQDVELENHLRGMADLPLRAPNAKPATEGESEDALQEHAAKKVKKAKKVLKRNAVVKRRPAIQIQARPVASFRQPEALA